MRPYYEHAGITIYHGDCLDVLPNVRADVLVTDPPYGISHESGREGPFQHSQIANDSTTNLRDTVLGMWGEGPAIVFGTWRRAAPEKARTALVWDKGPASGMGDLSLPWKCSWETVFICGSGFTGRRDEGVLRGHSVVTWASRGRRHPNEKPVTLLSALLSKCPVGVVLDPFMGSGTTLVAAKNLGRKAIGIEIEERYCEIAAKRLAQEQLPLDTAGRESRQSNEVGQ